MGKNTKRVKEFIESIPDSKLAGFSKNTGLIYKDNDFRLDMQGMTTGNPQKHNLQVQINKETTVTSLKKAAPATVAMAHVPDDESMTPQQIRDALIADIRV
ncbi:hypothetical protein PG996_003087 [Apiospora saccharicola]|uniref:Uncharacterized protein n=1 Tax=Apiospora saccharicola TaxID=335842 RepID=A0ABR1W0C1_9PEZI